MRLQCVCVSWQANTVASKYFHNHKPSGSGLKSKPMNSAAERDQHQHFTFQSPTDLFCSRPSVCRKQDGDARISATLEPQLFQPTLPHASSPFHKVQWEGLTARPLDLIWWSVCDLYLCDLCSVSLLISSLHLLLSGCVGFIRPRPSPRGVTHPALLFLVFFCNQTAAQSSDYFRHKSFVKALSRLRPGVNTSDSIRANTTCHP